MKPKEFKGTKGEWQIKVGNYPNSYFLQSEVADSEAGANAKLIAAAPELLKQLEFNLHAFTKIIGMIPEEGEIADPGQFIHDVQNTIFARFKSTREAIEKAI